ncbi:MAG: outer membrane beta-barrel protein [Proteobacteria bacterium]|nr:outer membrane beta-barrel protein [Pseudomonadota bacterium]
MPRLKKIISAFAALAVLAAAAGLTPALGQTAQTSEDLRRLRGGFEPGQSGNYEAATQSRNGEDQGTADGIFVTDPTNPLRDPLLIADVEAEGTVRRVSPQIAQDDPYAALGIPMGSFLLFPEITVQRVWDDNPFLSASDPQGDWALVLNPSLQVRSNWSRSTSRA